MNKVSLNFNNKKNLISVGYFESIEIPEIMSEIRKASNPQLFLWYIGTYGLKRAGVRFYKDFLINPILKNIKDICIWLVDLSAWGAFREKNIPISKESEFCKVINGFHDRRLLTVSAANIFQRMKKIKNCKLVEYFNRALSRDFVNHSSKDKRNTGTKLKEIFGNDCILISSLFDNDTSKCYSAIQYLESFFLIESAVNKSLEEGAKITEVIFILPNDELKYYQDQTNAFLEDLNFFMKALKVSDHVIDVKFISFKYGDVKHYRPYNAPGDVFNEGQLSFEDVVGFSSSFTEAGNVIG